MPLVFTPNAWLFGEVCLLDTLTVEKTVTLTNTEEKPVTITRLQPNCGCIEATTPRKLPLTLAPKESLPIDLKLLVYALPFGGSGNKAVSVYTGEKVAVFLPVVGSSKELIQFRPFLVEMGKVPIAEFSKPRSFVLELDPRLQKVPQPPLVTSTPHVQVKPVRFVRNGWAVTLAPDAPLGELRGIITFQVPEKDKTHLAYTWRRATCTVYGEIIGDIAASPTSLSLGILGKKPLTATVDLTERVPGALQGAEITSDHRLLTVQQRGKTLHITLAPGIPLGGFQAQVTVRLKNGQRLHIPVSAFRTQA